MIAFYIETPLQAICAKEVINNTKEAYYCIARFNGQSNSDVQLKETLRFLGIEFDRVNLQVLRGRHGDRKKFKLVQISRLLFSCAKIFYYNPREVYIGDYYSSVSAVVKIFLRRTTKTIYLDDGIATLKAISYLESVKVSAQFFSIFNETYSNCVSIQKNSLSSLKNRIQVEPFSDLGVLIGTHYVESGFSTRDDYIFLLRAIVANYKVPFSYYAHREEDDANLEFYATELGLKIEKSIEPIEITMLRNNLYPKVFVSVVSTASFTLKLLFPKAESFLVELPVAARSKESNYAGIIRYALTVFGSDNVITFEDAKSEIMV